MKFYVTFILMCLNIGLFYASPTMMSSDMLGKNSKQYSSYDLGDEMSSLIEYKPKIKRKIACNHLDNFDLETMPFQRQLLLKKEITDSTESRLRELKSKVKNAYDLMMEVLSMEDTMLDIINYNDLDLFIKKPLDAIFTDDSTPKARYLKHVLEKFTIFYNLFNYIINEKVDGKLINQNLHQLSFGITNIICNIKIILSMDNEPIEEEAIKILKINETNDKSQKYMRNVLILRHFKHFLDNNKIMMLLK